MMEREFTITVEDAAKYLNLYIGGDYNWEQEVLTRYKNYAKNHSEKEAGELTKNHIACAIMILEKTGMNMPNYPPDLLHSALNWSQGKSRDDWVKLLQQRVEEDKQIEDYRNQCLSLGVVYPIEYSPVTRQAFNWLFAKSEETGCVTAENKKEMVKRFQNLVMAYGGNVICNVFKKEEYKIKKKVLNWRTNYFFERLIFDIYSFDDVFATKKKELAKTNQSLIRKVRTD